MAYAVMMVGGTALLMAVLAGSGDEGYRSADGQPVTFSEVVMQSAAERALVSPRTAVLAGHLDTNERRGL